MNNDGKVPVIFLTIISIILLSTSVILYVTKENERIEKLTIQKRLDETVIIKKDLELKLKELEIQSAEMKTSIKYQEDKIGMLSQGLEEAKAMNTTSLAKLQEDEKEIENLKSKLEGEKQEKNSLLGQLGKLNEDYLGLKIQLENLMKTKEELEKKAKELAEKEGVSLGTIVISQPPQGGIKPIPQPVQAENR